MKPPPVGAAAGAVKPAPRLNPDPAAGVAAAVGAAEPNVSPVPGVVCAAAARPNAVLVVLLVGVPIVRPAWVLFTGVAKLNGPPGVGVLVAWVGVPKVKPPPEAAGAEPGSPKLVAGAAGFCPPKVKPPEGCPKLNPPLILVPSQFYQTPIPDEAQNGLSLLAGFKQALVQLTELEKFFVQGSRWRRKQLVKPVMCSLILVYRDGDQKNNSRSLPKNVAVSFSYVLGTDRQFCS